MCNLPYFPIVSSGKGADCEGRALDIMDELDPVCIGSGKCVNTKVVGDGAKGNDNVMDPMVAVILLVTVAFVLNDSVLDVGVGMDVCACTSCEIRMKSSIGQ